MTGSLDFSQTDLEQFVRASMPMRFGDVNPYDFEAFIAELFRRDGYDVRETQYSGDFGADLILELDKITTVVQVKRYAPQTQVGVGDLNQVIGGRAYYKAEKALVITTSGFTHAAITLARSAGIMLWDWNRLEQFISRVVLSGQDYYQYFSNEITEQENGNAFKAHFLRFQPGVATAHGAEAISVHIGLENLSDNNCYVQVEPPLIINRKQRQAVAVEWHEDYFHQGLLVSGATAEIACKFLAGQVPEVKAGDRIVLRVFIEGNPDPVLLDQRVGEGSGRCVVVTFCYGSGSPEHQAMIAWRNTVWYRSLAGRIAAAMYYHVSPHLVDYIQRKRMGWRILKSIVFTLARASSRIARRHQSQGRGNLSG